MDLLGPGAEAIARSVPSCYGMAAAAALLSLLMGSITCKASGRDPSAVGHPASGEIPPARHTGCSLGTLDNNVAASQVLVLALVISSSVLPSASAFDERPPSSLMPPSNLLTRPGSLSRYPSTVDLSPQPPPKWLGPRAKTARGHSHPRLRMHHMHVHGEG